MSFVHRVMAWHTQRSATAKHPSIQDAPTSGTFRRTLTQQPASQSHSNGRDKREGTSRMRDVATSSFGTAGFLLSLQSSLLLLPRPAQAAPRSSSIHSDPRVRALLTELRARETLLQSVISDSHSRSCVCIVSTLLHCYRVLCSVHRLHHHPLESATTYDLSSHDSQLQRQRRLPQRRSPTHHSHGDEPAL